MGQIFRRLGSEVTVIEADQRITGRENEAVSKALTEMLQAEGIRFHTGNKIERVEGLGQKRSDAGIAVTVGGQRVEGSHLLVATGRSPNTERLNLAVVGVETDERGFIPTNGKLETNVPGIWAVGDINKRGAFTHTSYQDGQIVLANLSGGARSADVRVSTYAMYTDPPLGRVGLSEAQARESGRATLVANFRMLDVSRAKEESETAGRNAHAVHRRTPGAPEQQAVRERRNLRRSECLEIGIRARRQMEVRRREARVGRAIGSLETPLPADLHIAVGGDLGHRHRIGSRHRIDEGPAAQMDRLDTGPVGAAGGDVLKGSDGDRMGFVVEARAVLTGKPDRPLRPTLRQDEVGVRIGCNRDRSVAMRGQIWPGTASSPLTTPEAICIRGR